MGSHSYPVEVQSDFLERITRAQPIQALAEFIWNSLIEIGNCLVRQIALKLLRQILVLAASW